MSLIRECASQIISVLLIQYCLINTTSVGMAPKTSKSPIDKKLLKGMVVMDVIYNPKYTKLLKDAQANRCKVISGEEMFVNQAMEQFNIWLK